MKRNLYRDQVEIRAKTDPVTGRDTKEAVYRGPYYRLNMPHIRKRKRSLMFALFAFFYLAVFLIRGFWNLPSSRCFYVLPFFLLMPFPTLYWLMAVYCLWTLPRRFTAIDRTKSLERLARSAFAAAVLSGLYVAGCALFLVLGGGDAFPEIPCMFLMTLAGVLAFFSVRLAKRMPVELQA